VTLWWIGNLILLVVTLFLAFLLVRFMKPIREIQKNANEILEHGAGLSRNLEAIPKLLQTQRLAGVARQGVGAYGAAITKLL
jgi:uncharacterized membrane-anchored protein YhcB (DUF1043 family)